MRQRHYFGRQPLGWVLLCHAARRRLVLLRGSDIHWFDAPAFRPAGLRCRAARRWPARLCGTEITSYTSLLGWVVLDVVPCARQLGWCVFARTSRSGSPREWCSYGATARRPGQWPGRCSGRASAAGWRVLCLETSCVLRRRAFRDVVRLETSCVLRHRAS